MAKYFNNWIGHKLYQLTRVLSTIQFNI